MEELLIALRQEWDEYIQFLKEKYPPKKGENFELTCEHHRRIDSILSDIDTSNILPNSAQKNYGADMYKEGYARGYQQCLIDIRKRRFMKEKGIFQRFGTFWDYFDDLLASNRRH